jgi:hypothetical protein
MSPAQTKLYFREWNGVRMMLRRQGVEAKECDARRHELHQQALGYQRSSKDFTNDELDRVLAEFRALTRPADLEAQLGAQAQPARRGMWKVRQLCAELGRGVEYASGIARRMNQEGRLGSADLEQLAAGDLRKVIIALEQQRRRMNQESKKAGKEEDSDTAAHSVSSVPAFLIHQSEDPF